MSLKQLLIAAACLLFMYLLFTAGAPFLLALIVAIFLEPLNRLFMQKFKLNRLAAGTISSTLFTVVLIGLMIGVGVKVFAEVIAFWDRAPQVVSEANTYLQDTIDSAKELYAHMPPDAAVQLESWLKGMTNTLMNIITSISHTFVNFAKGIPGMFIFFIVFLVAVYLFSYSLNTMKMSFLSIFHDSSRNQVDEVLQNLRRSVLGFLRSQLILSVLTYILTLIGLLILGLKYPLAIALLVVIVDIMPILGTGSVLVPWASYLLLTGNVYQGVGLIVLFLVITVFRRIVEPKVLGDAVGIGALSALISLYVGFKLVGVIGVFLGPLVVIVYMAARKAGLFQMKIKLD
ncbi:sporulation integral membrane protein YtvI [Paenibacillus phyllosphaerae]|uniref:Sporulation integral membrane protein YtvI n=1 Tax=Paenibacillus phyllosphaerae TaxID=274593 RepID=A0A7W5AT56_9BACL|nr:sporulation integral membrane protein YtvI [Paenibacillus phyllosphaerae]MBB3108289.1 sporulation integral membrane protein YtvI [Paenibacillus phyllosphaerae]